jgi:Na+-transporting methylmalonyl-CoA/oxaloacetate decarboxylase gamma subunit
MVFIGLILLWIMMDILVRLTSRGKTPDATVPTDAAEDVPVEAGSLLKQQAAAAAVATALALSSAARPVVVPQDKAALSPWQSTHRIRQINQTNALPRRKNN